MIRFVLSVILALSFLAPARAAPGEVSVAILEFGTVNWEFEAVSRLKLDKKNGFFLRRLKLAGNAATKIAFQGGAADAMVADWIWVARQRAAGKDYIFVPYSRAVGGIAVSGDSEINTLPDLKGKTLGIAGGPNDKSWIILQAYAQQEFGFDLAAETKQVFGAPPLIMQKTLDGELDAAVNYWHFLAKMQAKGFRIVAPVNEAAEGLGLDPDTPMLGYVFKGQFVRENERLFNEFLDTSRRAKQALRDDDALWEEIRPQMRAKSDAEFDALKAGFRAGIPVSTEVSLDSARALFALMVEIGGEALVGEATELPDGVFYQRP